MPINDMGFVERCRVGSLWSGSINEAIDLEMLVCCVVECGKAPGGHLDAREGFSAATVAGLRAAASSGM